MTVNVYSDKHGYWYTSDEPRSREDWVVGSEHEVSENDVEVHNCGNAIWLTGNYECRCGRHNWGGEL